MTTKFTGDFSKDKVTINLNDMGTISYYLVKPIEANEESIFVIMKNSEVIGLSFGGLSDMNGATNFLEIVVPDNIIPPDFFYFLTKKMEQDGYSLSADYKMTISDESASIYQKYWENILPLLTAFGIKVAKPKKVISKPRHKFVATLAEVPFKIDYKNSKATVYWVKRNKFVIKSGATLVPDAPLTKAGIIGFAGKFGLRLRQEHEEQIKDNVLTSDIELRSVNEVGTFLYFAGTNSWLQLKSPEGKTLNELTIVK